MCGTVPGRAATSMGLDVYKVTRPPLRKHTSCERQATSSLLLNWTSDVPFLFHSGTQELTGPCSSVTTHARCEDAACAISPGDPGQSLPSAAMTSTGRGDRATSHGHRSPGREGRGPQIHRLPGPQQPCHCGFLLYHQTSQEMLKGPSFQCAGSGASHQSNRTCFTDIKIRSTCNWQMIRRNYTQ